MGPVKLIDVHNTGRKLPDEEKILIPRAKKRGRLIKILFCAFILFFVASTCFILFALRNLPSIEALKNFTPPIISEVFDTNGKKIGEFSAERRILTPLEQIPKMLKQAFIASEDDRFYEHKGLDWHGIARAFVTNILAGEVKQGGSTITQQVAKSLLLSPEKSLSRKVREAILAFKMEKNLSKDEILYLYLNEIYLGHGSYGVTAAADNYFGKKISELDLAESSLFAGLVQAPSKYNPYTHLERARVRQGYVLSKMLENRFITKEEHDTALKTEMHFIKKEDINKTAAPYFTENVRKYLVGKYGNDTVLTEGLKVFTTLDINMQKAAERALRGGLSELDKRQGYRGPSENVEKIDEYKKSLLELNKEKDRDRDLLTAVVTKVDDQNKFVNISTGINEGKILLDDMKWARKPDPEIRSEWAYITKPSAALKTGDVVKVMLKPEAVPKEKQKKSPAAVIAEKFFTLEQEPLVEGVIVAMDVQTGQIKSMVGGYDFERSEFNRATQAMRQPGSAFKPVIYAAAIDKGYTASKMLIDAPVVFDDPVQELQWRPKNYEGKFSGNTILRDALIKSRNVPTIKIVEDIGIEYVINYARKIGVLSPLSRNFSLALGSSVLTPLELAKIYAVFAAGGRIIQPVFIKKIEDRNGNVLEENVLEPTLISKTETSTPTAVPTSTASSTETATPEASPRPVEEKVQDQNQKDDKAPLPIHFLPDGVISLETSYIITHLLKEVVRFGTGYRVKALGRPAAGKTGTTNDNVDAWFVGYTPELVAAVWVGFDEKKPLGKGEVGGMAASPIWLNFMKDALAGMPVKDFAVPEGIVFVSIDPKTGKLATDKSQAGIFEAFIDGTQPTVKSGKEVDSQIKNFFIDGQ